jgi:uncharacterized protein YciI
VSYFAVTRHAGPAWVDGHTAFDQPDALEHAAYMNQLADQGSVIFAGPLAGTERDRIRVLLVMNAKDEADIHDRLRDDPWARNHRLDTVTIEPWNVIVGGDRLLGPYRATDV